MEHAASAEALRKQLAENRRVHERIKDEKAGKIM
jgi:hypothetical protein